MRLLKTELVSISDVNHMEIDDVKRRRDQHLVDSQKTPAEEKTMKMKQSNA